VADEVTAQGGRYLVSKTLWWIVHYFSNRVIEDTDTLPKESIASPVRSFCAQRFKFFSCDIISYCSIIY
jgi:hypothetical protein